MKLSMKKKCLALVLSCVMVLGMPLVSNAAAVITDVHHSSGTYYLSVYKSGSATLLGEMILSHTSTELKNTFRAKVYCSKVIVYVKAKGDNSFVQQPVIGLSAGNSIAVTKKDTSGVPYGYCYVEY